jgi:signal transduction histidine kinase
MGLQIMRYRADRIGGRLTIDSIPGTGTTVRSILRLESRQAERPRPE